MSDVRNPLKSVQLVTVLTRDKFVNNSVIISENFPSHFADLSVGNWLISINDVTYSNDKLLAQSYFFNISSKLVLHQTWKNGTELVHEPTVLARFEAKRSSKASLILYPHPNWFFINSLSNQSISLQLSLVPNNFSYFYNEKPELTVVITVHLKRYN